MRLCLFRSVCLVKITHTQGQAHRGEVMYGAAPQEEVGGVSVASLVIKSAMKVRCVRGRRCGMGHRVGWVAGVGVWGHGRGRKVV